MDLREAMFHKLLTLPTPFYDDHATGNLISKLTFDVTQVTEAATNVVTVSAARLHYRRRFAGLAVLPQLETYGAQPGDAAGHRVDPEDHQRPFA